MTDRKCTVCGAGISAKRIARYPIARLCGADSCTVTNSRRKAKVKQASWLKRRIEQDPGFRLKALAGCRRRYVARRRAAGKTVGPPAPWRAERTNAG